MAEDSQSKGAQLKIVVLVFAVLAGLFVVTGSYTGVYRAERLQRAETHFRKGENLARQGHAAQAAEEYRAALTFAPNDSRYRLALAGALIDAGQLQEAESHLIGLHGKDPDNALIDLLLARIAAREGSTDEAVAQYQQAIYGLWPDDPVGNRMQARFELVSLLGQTGHSSQALAELMVLANAVPDDPAVQKRIADLLLRYGSAQRAGDMFARVAQKNPNDVAAQVGAGEAAFAQGNYPAAADWFRKALRVDESNSEAQRRLRQTEEIQALDPSLVRLSAATRYERSRTLVQKTLTSLDACVGSSPPSDAQNLISSANEFLRASRRRREDDTPTAIDLAERLWHARKQHCGKSASGNEALDLVMSKVAK